MSRLRPSTIIWIYTSRCNLSCLHCYAYRFRDLEELPLDRKLSLIDEFYDVGVEHVGLSGGEPFIHPHTVEIVKKLGSYGFEISMVTNGIAMNEELMSLIQRYNVLLYVSIDGGKEEHEKIRGVGTFDKVMEFLNKLKSRGIEFGTVMALNKINYRAVEKYIEIALRYGAKEIAFIPVMPVGRARQNRIYIESSELVEVLRRVDGIGQDFGLVFDFWCTPFVQILGLRNIRGYGCRTYDVVDIDPAGRLLLCDTVDIVITDVVNKPLSKALEEYFSNPIVEKVVNPMDSACKSCPFFYGCKGGCFSRSYAIFGDLNAGDPLCPYIAKNRIAGLKS